MNDHHAPIEFRKVRGFSESINDSFTFIKENIRPLLRPLLYICGFFILATMISQVLQQVKVAKIIGLAKSGATSGAYAASLSRYSFGLEYFLLILFTALSVSSVYLVAYCYIRLYKEQGNTPPSVGEIWEAFKQQIVSFFVGSIVLGLFLVLGCLFCLVPGLYLMPIASLSLAIMVMEDKNVLEAFSRAMDLIKNQWWKSFALFFVAGVITYFCMGILGIPSALINLGNYFLEDSSSLILIGSIVGALLSGLAHLFYILPAIVSALWYFSLLEEKEGIGLMERIDEMGKDQGPQTDWPREEY